jgi:hypothetical protein
VTPEAKILNTLIDYDSKTGRMTWRHRDREFFPHDGGWRAWNTAWAGKPALASIDTNGYPRGAVLGVWMKAHRAAWAIVHGSMPAKHIDHINGNPADNRIANLRLVSPGENSRNIRKSSANTSGVLGVHWNQSNQKWIAAITHEGKVKYLGCYKRFDIAVWVRLNAERDLGFHPNHGRMLTPEPNLIRTPASP